MVTSSYYCFTSETYKTFQQNNQQTNKQTIVYFLRAQIQNQTSKIKLLFGFWSYMRIITDDILLKKLLKIC